MQGFIIESDYEGDEGHPRVGLIQPGTAANDVLVQGDIILSIDGVVPTSPKHAVQLFTQAEYVATVVVIGHEA